MPIDDVNIGFIIGLPPEKAVTYFESKGNKITWDWHDMLDDAHQRAFTVAKVSKADVLQDIRTAMQKAIKNETGWEDFKKDLIPTLKRKGWWGKEEIIDEQGNIKTVQLGSERRLKLIYDTNLQIAFSQGNYKAQMAAIDIAPFGQYVTKEDNKVRISHALLNRKVYRLDDPFWDHFYPPNGFRCRCKVITLTQRQIDKQKLDVDSAVGKIRSVQRNIGDKQVFNSSLTIETKNGRRNVSPDLGWNYNPAKGYFDLKQDKYDADIWKRLSDAINSNSTVPIISKDIQEAEKFAEKHITKLAVYEGFDIEIANKVNNHIRKRLSELNYMPKKLNSITSIDTDEYSMAINPANDLKINKKLILNESFSRNYQKTISKTKKVHLWVHFSDADALSSIIDHELGHIVQNKIWGSFEKTNTKKILAWRNIIKTSEKHGWLYPTTYALEGNIKKYETKKDILLSQLRECFSECYSLYLNDKLYLLSNEILSYFNSLGLRKKKK